MKKGNVKLLLIYKYINPIIAKNSITILSIVINKSNLSYLQSWLLFFWFIII